MQLPERKDIMVPLVDEAAGKQSARSSGSNPPLRFRARLSKQIDVWIAVGTTYSVIVQRKLKRACDRSHAALGKDNRLGVKLRSANVTIGDSTCLAVLTGVTPNDVWAVGNDVTLRCTGTAQLADRDAHTVVTTCSSLATKTPVNGTKDCQKP